MDQLTPSGASGSIPILLVIALIGAGAALFGHFVVRSNAKLQAAIGEKTADLNNKQSRENAILAASLSANVKLAEMRQAWINELRNEMTQFHMLCNTKREASSASSPISLNELHKSGTKIELSMNPFDEDYGELRATMFCLYEEVPSGKTAEELSDRYVHVCQRILKREWDRLQGDIKNVINIQSNPDPNERPAIPWYRR